MNEPQQQRQNFTSLLKMASSLQYMRKLLHTRQALRWSNQIMRLLTTRLMSTRAEKKARRQEIIAEFKKGYFADIKEFQETGGKRFTASNELTERKDSIPFPSFTAKSLSGRQVNLAEEFPNHVTLLLIAMRGIAQPMNDEYRKAFHVAFSHSMKAKCIEVNVIGSLFYGIFRFFISRKLRENIPQDRHDSFLCFYGSFEKLTSSDLIGNAIVGHAFLIDSEGFVRWKACAKPTKDELESMIKCSKQLLP